MKKLSIIIGLLGFFAISCATTTANTDQRKVSAINNQNNVAFNWKFWEKTKEEPEPPSMLQNCIDKCRHDPCHECEERCHTRYSKTPGVKVASINDQNPFMLLEEVSQDAPPPLMLADDYSDCMDDCICRAGGSSEGCDAICKYK